MKGLLNEKDIKLLQKVNKELKRVKSNYTEIEVKDIVEKVFVLGLNHNLKELPTARVVFDEFWEKNKKKI